MSVKAPPLSMRREKFCITGPACRCKYRSISSERHLPNRRIMSPSTLAHSSALAPAARRQRAETSVGRKPSAGPRKWTARRRVLVIREGVILAHWVGVIDTRANGVVSGARARRRWSMRRSMARTGQSWLQPLRERPMTSPRTPFFWLVNVREAKVVDCMFAMDAVVMFRRCSPMKSCTSHIRKGLVSDGESVYSPGRRRKKKARMIMSEMAWSTGSVPAVAMMEMCRRTLTGTGFTRSGGGSVFFHALIIRVRRKSILPWAVYRGSSVPKARNVWPTDRR